MYGKKLIAAALLAATAFPALPGQAQTVVSTEQRVYQKKEPVAANERENISADKAPLKDKDEDQSPPRDTADGAKRDGIKTGCVKSDNVKSESEQSPQDKARADKSRERERRRKEKAAQRAEKRRQKAEQAKQRAAERAKRAEQKKRAARKNDKTTVGQKTSPEYLLTADWLAEELAKPHPFVPADWSNATILGLPVATQGQCLAYLLKNNPTPDISVAPAELVGYYYEEALLEGVRPDVAFVQALKETGFFRYGGTVTPDQNNYCGLGTTSAVVKGGYFPSAQIGVRAHIQHLMAYATERLPQTEIVDPRYWLVRDIYGANVMTDWVDLNGRWAVPGTDYGESILWMFQELLTMP